MLEVTCHTHRLPVFIASRVSVHPRCQAARRVDTFGLNVLEKINYSVKYGGTNYCTVMRPGCLKNLELVWQYFSTLHRCWRWSNCLINATLINFSNKYTLDQEVKVQHHKHGIYIYIYNVVYIKQNMNSRFIYEITLVKQFLLRMTGEYGGN